MWPLVFWQCKADTTKVRVTALRRWNRRAAWLGLGCEADVQGRRLRVRERFLVRGDRAVDPRPARCAPDQTVGRGFQSVGLLPALSSAVSRSSWAGSARVLSIRVRRLRARIESVGRAGMKSDGPRRLTFC